MSTPKFLILSLVSGSLAVGVPHLHAQGAAPTPVEKADQKFLDNIDTNEKKSVPVSPTELVDPAPAATIAPAAPTHVAAQPALVRRSEPTAQVSAATPVSPQAVPVTSPSAVARREVSPTQTETTVSARVANASEEANSARKERSKATVRSTVVSSRPEPQKSAKRRVATFATHVEAVTDEEPERVASKPRKREAVSASKRRAVKTSEPAEEEGGVRIVRPAPIAAPPSPADVIYVGRPVAEEPRDEDDDNGFLHRLFGRKRETRESREHRERVEDRDND